MTTDKVTVDVYQTDGVSKTEEEIPGWRPFLLKYIKNVKKLNESFEVAEGYDPNPESGKYDDCICKIQ